MHIQYSINERTAQVRSFIHDYSEEKFLALGDGIRKLPSPHNNDVHYTGWLPHWAVNTGDLWIAVATKAYGFCNSKEVFVDRYSRNHRLLAIWIPTVMERLCFDYVPSVGVHQEELELVEAALNRFNCMANNNLLEF